MSHMYSQVEWKISLESNDEARHQIKIQLFNATVRVPSIEDYLTIKFAERGPKRDFEAKIGTTKLNQGNECSYIPETDVFRIDLNSLNTNLIGSADPIIIEFVQEKVVSRIFDVNVTNLGLIETLHASSIQLDFSLPRMSRLRKGITLLFCRLQKKTIFQILPLPYSAALPQSMDENEGTVSYKLTNLPEKFGFAFKQTGRLNISSAVIGFLVGVIGTIISTIFADNIRQLIKSWTGW